MYSCWEIQIASSVGANKVMSHYRMRSQQHVLTLYVSCILYAWGRAKAWVHWSFNKYFSSDSCESGRLLYVGEFIQWWTAMGWTTYKKTPANCSERPDNLTWRSIALNFHIKYVRSIIFVSLNIYTSESGQWSLFLNITKHIFFLWGKMCITLTIPQFS